MVDVRRFFIESPVNTGFRIGFVAVFLIIVTAIFPTVTGVGIDNPTIDHFMDLFQIGLVLTIFFAFWLRGKSGQKTKSQNFTPIELGVKNLGKQASVLILGTLAGVIMVIVNYFAFSGANLFLDVTAATVDVEAFYLGMLAGVAEELFFRGAIQTFLRIYAPGMIFAIIPTAIIFTLYHYLRFQMAAVLFVVFILGVFLGYVHEQSNDIGVPMLAHVINNTYAMLPVVVTVILANSLYLGALVVLAIVVYYAALSVDSPGQKKFGKKKNKGGRPRGR